VTGFGITETPCARLKASGKNVVGGTVAFVPVGCTASTGQALTSGAGTILATATKVTSDNLAPLREGDEGSCTGAQAGQAGPIVCNCTMKVANSGQQKAKCE